MAIKPPSASPAAQPSAFFTKPVKKGSPSMRVKEDFTPFKNTRIPEPAQVAPTWAAFTGKSYRAMWPAAHGPGLEEDPSLGGVGGMHHLPPGGPPGSFNPYQQYQPPSFQQPQQQQQQPRFPQPGPPQQGGPPQPPPQIPPHLAGPPLNGGGFQHFQGMPYPQPGVGGPPHGQPSKSYAFMDHLCTKGVLTLAMTRRLAVFSPQQMAAGQVAGGPPGQFMRFPQFPPQAGQPGQQGEWEWSLLVRRVAG